MILTFYFISFFFKTKLLRNQLNSLINELVVCETNIILNKCGLYDIISFIEGNSLDKKLLDCKNADQESLTVIYILITPLLYPTIFIHNIINALNVYFNHYS